MAIACIYIIVPPSLISSGIKVRSGQEESRWINLGYARGLNMRGMDEGIRE